MEGLVEHMNKDFEIVGLSVTDKGLLKKVGERAVVASVKMLPGADHVDNEWVMEAFMAVYAQYYARVKEYSKQEGL